MKNMWSTEPKFLSNGLTRVDKQATEGQNVSAIAQ